MTVTSQTARNDYNGNGVTTQFPVTFRFLENSHLKVLRTVVSTGITTTLTLNAAGANGYTVTGAQQPAGGAITLNTAPVGPNPNPALQERISILRNVPLTQDTDYLPNDPFPAETHERALDKLTMIVQQQTEVTDRAITLPPGTVGVSTQLPGPQPLYLLRWKADLTGLENGLPPEIATVAPGAVVDATVSPIAGIQSSKLAFQQTGTGSASRTVESKLQDTVSAFDFMSAAQRSDVIAGTMAVDVTAAIQAAVNTGKVVLFPQGKYRIGGTITLSAGGGIQGSGERTQFTRFFTGGRLIGHPGGTQLGDPIILRDFSITTDPSVTVGSSDTGIDIGYATAWAQRGDISNLTILKQWDGLKWTGGTMGSINSVQCLEGKGRGFVGVNARGELNGCLSQFNASHGYFIYAQTSGETGIQFTSCGTFANGGWGFLYDGAVDGANIYMKGCTSSFDGGGGIGFSRKFEQIYMTQILSEYAGEANVFQPSFPLQNLAVGMLFAQGCDKIVASDMAILNSRGVGLQINGITAAAFANVLILQSGRGGVGGFNASGIAISNANSDVSVVNLIANRGATQTTDINIASTTANVDFVNANFRTYSTNGGVGARFTAPRTTAPAAVNAASVVTLFDYVDFQAVNGVTNINAITASWAGRRVTLLFTGSLTVADGNNLKLNGPFSATPDDTLTLVCDGTNWYEVSRSAN